MVKIASENTDIERELVKLCGLLETYGGFIDERLTIREKGGNLSIEAPEEVSKTTTILRAPRDALLYLDLFDVAAEGDDFVLKNVKPEANEAQRSLMESMLTVYNLCGKIPDYKKYATVNLLSHDRPLLTRLLNEKVVQEVERKLAQNPPVSGFFHTRQLGTKKLNEAKVRAALMPVIDFLNHNFAAGNYHLKDEDLEIMRSSSAQGGAECFVRYGAYDSFDMLMTYGYVDPTAPYVYARPTTLEVEGVGSIRVELQNRKFQNKKLPAQVSDLRGFFPPLQKVGGAGELMVGFLRIPTLGSPRALRRVLRAIISTMSTGSLPEEIMAFVDTAERQIVEGTRSFYEELNRDMAAYDANPEVAPIIQNIYDVAKIQLNYLKAYDYDIARTDRPARKA